jgi:murein DD-endopeptidase MepM/ murein hydrolase activator NlpD
MKAAALVLSAFTGLPTSPTEPNAILQPTTVGWPDSWSLIDPLVRDNLPESSAVDEDGVEVSEETEPEAHYLFVGCELALGGSLDPEAWARDLWQGAPKPRFVEAGHTEKDGQWLDYEQIPRRPERPEAYVAYRYPVADAPVVSGYDLDKPDDEQRRGHMHAIGHGGVDLMAPMGTPITMVRLEHQLGDAEVLYAGPLYGETVVTRHSVREGGVARDYVLIFGHLDHVADDVRRGRRLREGAMVGFVGNSDSPELIHLHLEARRVRDGVDPWRFPAALLAAREYTTVTDPRNVLPLRAPRLPSPRCKPRLASAPRTYWLGQAWTLELE